MTGDHLTFPNLERSGRLGNQLWQVASTLGIARRHGLHPRFPEAWSYRPFFSIPDEYFGDQHGTVAWRHPDVAHMDERTRVYLQDLAFIAEVEDEIREWFRPSERAQHQLCDAVRLATIEPTLVIHVRRGDNLNQQQCYPIPNLEYYLDAVRRHPGHDVVIFGDDPIWNRNVLRPRVEPLTSHPNSVFTVTGIPRPKEHEESYWTAPILDWIDLFAMTEFGTHGAFCLSNSTLGWWGAWLSGSDDVCYPSPWYGPALDVHQGQGGYIDGSLMMPPQWQRVVANGISGVPCRQDHVHNDICRTMGDAPVHTPRRFQYPVGGPVTDAAP